MKKIHFNKSGIIIDIKKKKPSQKKRKSRYVYSSTSTSSSEESFSSSFSSSSPPLPRFSREDKKRKQHSRQSGQIVATHNKKSASIAQQQTQQQSKPKTVSEIINNSKDLTQFSPQMLQQAILKLSQEKDIIEANLGRIGHVRNREQLNRKIEGEKRLDEIERSIDRIRLHIKTQSM
jgi:hypothetical protein